MQKVAFFMHQVISADASTVKFAVIHAYTGTHWRI
jgi:hypothetical protein